MYSVRDAIRTRDLPLRRRTLYPAELRKLITAACHPAFADPGKKAGWQCSSVIITHFFSFRYCNRIIISSSALFGPKLSEKAALPYRSAALPPVDIRRVIPVTADPSARSGIFPAAPSPVPHGAPCHGTFSCRQESGFPPPCHPPPGKQHSRS